MSKSSAFSTNTPFIFEIQETNGALFFKMAHYFFISSLSLSLVLTVTVTIPLTTIYASLKSHKSDLKIDVLNLICLLLLYVSPD